MRRGSVRGGKGKREEAKEGKGWQGQARVAEERCWKVRGGVVGRRGKAGEARKLECRREGKQWGGKGKLGKTRDEVRKVERGQARG